MLWERDEFAVDTEPARIDVAAVHAFLTESYWAKGIPLDVVRRAIEGSLCFGLYATTPGACALAGEQVGFARLVTDRATFAYLADVFVVEAWRGRGLATWLMSCIVAHPDVQGLRRWVLATRDAHALYAKFGFTPIANPERWMHRWDPEVYTR